MVQQNKIKKPIKQACTQIMAPWKKREIIWATTIHYLLLRNNFLTITGKWNLITSRGTPLEVSRHTNVPRHAGWESWSRESTLQTWDYWSCLVMKSWQKYLQKSEHFKNRLIEVKDCGARYYIKGTYLQFSLCLFHEGFFLFVRLFPYICWTPIQKQCLIFID